jgi:hypothetical protein
MVEGFIESASEREWAVRDQLTAKAAAFASDEVRDLWQQSALAKRALQSYADGNWIGLPELVIAGVRWVSGSGQGSARQAGPGIQGSPWAARVRASRAPMPWRAAVAR